MNQIDSVAILNVNGRDRISYTYDKINVDTGEPISENNVGGMWVFDESIVEHINAIRKYILDTKLNEE